MSERQELRYPIYPEIKVECNILRSGDWGREINNVNSATQTITRGATYLRQQHTDGKWYLQLFREENVAKGESKDISKQKSIVKERIGYHVYLAMMFGEIDPYVKVANPIGYEDNLFLLDLCQESEEERLGL